MAVTHNFFIDQGSDFAITFIYQDPDGNRIDISEGTVAFRFRGNDSNVIYEYIWGGLDGYVTSGGIGAININLPAAFTQTLDFSTAVYDLDFQPDKERPSDPTSNIRIATGVITLIRKNFNTFVGEQQPPDTGDDGGGIVLPPSTGDEDLCSSALSCVQLDIYSVVYSGSGINIFDNQDNSGTISNVDDTRIIDKVEVVINNLRHESPQDLTFLLQPPSGNTVLLSSSDKITKYNPETNPNGFSFIYSNRARPDIFLNNVAHNGLCNIRDKTDIVQYSGHTLESSFDHLVGHAVTGDFTLYVNDNDVFGSGSLASWDLIITYQ